MVVHIRRQTTERSIRIVTESHDSSAVEVCGKEILEPEFLGLGFGPRSSRMALKAVDRNNTRSRKRQL